MVQNQLIRHPSALGAICRQIGNPKGPLGLNHKHVVHRDLSDGLPVPTLPTARGDLNELVISLDAATTSLVDPVRVVQDTDEARGDFGGDNIVLTGQTPWFGGPEGGLSVSGAKDEVIE